MKNSAGYATASTGHVSIHGRTITISGLTRTTRETVTITYGSKANGGPGARAPTTEVGAQTWQAQEKSVPGGSLTMLATPPKITIT
jgi:hypothetical protein